MSWVVDASVALKWVIPEVLSEQAGDTGYTRCGQLVVAE